MSPSSSSSSSPFSPFSRSYWRLSSWTLRRLLSSAFLVSAVSLSLLCLALYARDDDGLRRPFSISPLSGTVLPPPAKEPFLRESSVGSGQETTADSGVTLAPTAEWIFAGTTTAARTGPLTTDTMAGPSSSTARPATTEGGPVVSLPQGRYRGLVLPADECLPRALDVWRGIPYARSRRLEPAVPEPAAPSPAAAAVVRPAVEFGKVCPRADPDPSYEADEDCLSLNVYRTRDANNDNSQGSAKGQSGGGAKRLLPVVVYVHGGAFNMGKAQERNMGAFVAHSAAPLIGVSFNYRLGPLGFLPAGLTTKAGLLNLGLRDQQLALEWVKEHAAAFGGDPENITLMGLSAGAHSIGHQILAYEDGKAPFTKCILESGAATARAVFNATHPRHELQFREFLVEAGMGTAAEHAVLDGLRAAPLPVLTAAWRAVWARYEPSVRWPFQPVIDAGPGPDLVPDRPAHSWAAGRSARVPVITGFDSHEGTAFVPKSAATSADFRDFFRVLIPTFSDPDLDALEKLYPDPTTDAGKTAPYAQRRLPDGCGPQFWRLENAYAHYAYIFPVLMTAHHVALRGQSARVYEFAARAAPYDAANHGDEAPVAAHDMDLLAALPGLTAVADAMHGSFARFAAAPASAGRSTDARLDLGAVGDVAEWPEFVSPFDEHGRPKTRREGDGVGLILVFGEGNDERSFVGSGARVRGRAPGVPARVRALTGLEVEQCKFWWDRVGLSQGMGRRNDEGPRAKL